MEKQRGFWGDSLWELIKQRTLHFFSDKFLDEENLGELNILAKVGSLVCEALPFSKEKKTITSRNSLPASSTLNKFY